MPCDRKLKNNQTIQQRAAEVRRAVANLSSGLTSGKIKAIVGAQGGVVFQGLGNQDRDGVTDGCLYRRVMATGSVTAKLAIARAEQLAGRSIDQKSVAQGVHSHDGGKSWHHGH